MKKKTKVSIAVIIILSAVAIFAFFSYYLSSFGSLNPFSSKYSTTAFSVDTPNNSLEGIPSASNGKSVFYQKSSNQHPWGLYRLNESGSDTFVGSNLASYSISDKYLVAISNNDCESYENCNPDKTYTLHKNGKNITKISDLSSSRKYSQNSHSYVDVSYQKLSDKAELKSNETCVEKLSYTTPDNSGEVNLLDLCSYRDVYGNVCDPNYPDATFGCRAIGIDFSWYGNTLVVGGDEDPSAHNQAILSLDSPESVHEQVAFLLEKIRIEQQNDDDGVEDSPKVWLDALGVKNYGNANISGAVDYVIHGDRAYFLTVDTEGSYSDECIWRVIIGNKNDMSQDLVTAKIDMNGGKNSSRHCDEVMFGRTTDEVIGVNAQDTLQIYNIRTKSRSTLAKNAKIGAFLN